VRAPARLSTLLLLAAAGVCVAGCKADPPGRLETRVVTAAKRKVLVGGKSDKNPLEATQQNIAAGRETFSHYCFACHGLDGQNSGVPFAESMSPPVPPLNSERVQAYTDGQLRWVIHNGIRPSGMPKGEGILTDEEIWQTVLYIRHLPAKGSLGEPAMYAGDSPVRPPNEKTQSMALPR
jgi:mono/diheme cytochrome c family protein